MHVTGLKKKLTSGDKVEKGLLVIYYSGHGQIANNVTNIICEDGQLFPLPLAVYCPNKNSFKEFGIGITTLPNTMVLVFMDCCRLLPKGGEDDNLTTGEFYIYYAVKPGTAASTSSGEGAISEWTKKVLSLFAKQLGETGKILIPDNLDLDNMDKGGSLKIDLAGKPVKIH